MSVQNGDRGSKTRSGNKEKKERKIITTGFVGHGTLTQNGFLLAISDLTRLGKSPCLNLYTYTDMGFLYH